MNQILGTGLLEQEVDVRDFTSETLGISPVDSLHSIELDLPDFVYDQGQSMLCSAYTIAMACYMINGSKVGFSPTSIYARKSTSGEGARLRDMMNLWKKGGISLDYLFNEYYTAEDCIAEYQRNKEEADYVSQLGRIKYFYDCQSREDLVKALELGLPIVGSVTLYDNFYPDHNGIIPQSSGNIIGGHAILVVGYDEENDRVKILNSWGDSWGINGTAWMNYSMLGTSYVPVDANTAVKNVTFQIGRDYYTKNGEKVYMTGIDGNGDEVPVSPFISNSRTYIPLKFVADSLDVNTTWINSVQGIVLEG